jgi:hypothetical protein
MIDIKKYLLTLLITSSIFVTAFFASTYFSSLRTENVKEIQDTIAIDILASETQFDLLKEIPCSHVNDTVLSEQLSLVGEKLSFTENERGGDDATVQYLKKYYSLLQVKDYLLSKKLTEKCGQAKKTVSVIYFYTNRSDCKDCAKQGYVLTRLKELYPNLRIYSFDYDLDLSVVDSLKAIYKVTGVLPTIIIDDKVYAGFKTVEEVEALLPESFKVESNASSTAATTTKKK